MKLHCQFITETKSTQKIENLKKTAEATEESIKIIKANVDNKKVQTRIAQFQDDLNNVIKVS